MRYGTRLTANVCSIHTHSFYLFLSIFARFPSNPDWYLPSERGTALGLVWRGASLLLQYVVLAFQNGVAICTGTPVVWQINFEWVMLKDILLKKKKKKVFAGVSLSKRMIYLLTNMNTQTCSMWWYSWEQKTRP